MGTAAVALPLLVLLLFKAPPMATVAFLAVACAIGLRELFTLFGAGGLAPFRVIGAAGAAVLFFSVATPWLVILPALPAITVAIAAAALHRAREMSASVPAAAATLLAAAYLGALGGTMAALRILPPDSDGAWRVTLLLAIVMTSDTFACFLSSPVSHSSIPPTLASIASALE